MASDITVVVDRRGRTTPLGEFVFRLLEESGKSVSQLSRDANLSRSFLYLLKDDRQVPSLDTLVALFDAIGVDDVRIADADEPGELALVVNGRPWWIRLPGSNRRAARARSALETLTTASMSAADDLYVSAPPAPSTRGAAYSRDSAFARSSKPSDRQRLLGELLSAAGELDKQRLELLVENAKLLGKG